MMRLSLLQHVSFEGPGAIADWVEPRDTLQVVRLDRGDPLPKVDDFDGLIVMGGPMGVGDDQAHPWLRVEKQLIAQALAADRRVLGICLGAQLVANVLGARVAPNAHKEIGWHAVEWSAEARTLYGPLPTTSIVFQWHGDTFDLPQNTVALASSAACRNQGFAARGGTVIGLQFHLESRPEDIAALLHAGQDELSTGGPYIQSAEQIRQESPERCAALGPLLRCMLDDWTAAASA
jgi:GMP synthase-like glutamine amidotransferase